MVESRSFAEIPSLIEFLFENTSSRNALTVPSQEFLHSWRKVVCILVDGFGMRFVRALSEYSDSPVQRVFSKGTLLPYRAQFPSTTTAHMVTIHCGPPVEEHGFYEWQFYEPLLDEVICLLQGTVLNDTDPYKEVELPLSDLIPWSTVYQRLSLQGVSCFLYQPSSFIHSPFSRWIGRGATRCGFDNLSHLAQLVTTNLKASDRSYSFLYISSFDSTAHMEGPLSEKSIAEGMRIFTTLENIIEEQKEPETLFLITADHGQVEMDYRTTLFLDRQPYSRKLSSFLRTTKSGRLALPGGSHRDVFLWAKEGATGELVALLKNELGEKAEVLSKDEMLSRGLFRSSPSKAFLSRLGDVLILPQKNESVFWEGPGGIFTKKFLGHHGGLTHEECDIPLLVRGVE